MDRGDATERPQTSNVRTAGGSGRGLRRAVVLAILALAIAVLKPWSWIAGPPGAPGREGAAISAAPAGSTPAAAPTPPPRDWAIVDTQIVCLSGTDWLAVVDQVDGPTTSRSWTRLDLVPATNPLDPAIVRTRVYADSVPRIGFCAAGLAGTADGVGAASAARRVGAGTRLLVRVWRLAPLVAAAGAKAAPAPTADPGTSQPGARRAVELMPLLISGGTVAEGGSLFGPPARLSMVGPARQAADPEGAWAAGGLAPAPARWRADGGEPAPASWPPGTYVFRVDLEGAGAPGSDVSRARAPGTEVAWFAIELRGPWIVPGASDAP